MIDARSARAALAAFAIAAAGPAMVAAEPISAARLDQLAKMEDWSGRWREAAGKAHTELPPYNAEWKAQYDANLKKAAAKGADRLIDTHDIHCVDGFPRNVSNGLDHWFQIRPEMTFAFAGGEMRIIYTDGRERPAADETWPKFQGWSAGRWEGSTLIVETRSLKPELWAGPTPILFSDKAIVEERIRMTGPNALEDRVTITDSASLTAPWTFTRTYARQDFKAWSDEKKICNKEMPRTSPLQASAP